jgi:hypothetical protein
MIRGQRCHAPAWAWASLRGGVGAWTCAMQIELHQLELRYAGLRAAAPERRRKLLSSLCETGQQAPVIVVAAASAERYVLIDGYLRVEVLRKLGRDTVEATLWPLGESEALIARFHLEGRARSTLEEAWLLEHLAKGRGAITGRAGTAFVPQQELGVAPAGAAQIARTRDAGQGCGWTAPSAGGDEVSVAVGPGQPSTRQRAGRGTWRAASLGAAGGTTVGCVPRCGPGRTGTALRIAATISADGGAGRTRGTGPSRRHRAPTGGPGRHRGAVRSRPAARAEGALRRGIGAGTGKDLGRADRSAWGDGDAGRRAFGEARL